MDDADITLTLTVAEVNTVLAALSEMPFKLVGNIITSIKKQGDAQLAELKVAAEQEPAAEMLAAE